MDKLKRIIGAITMSNDALKKRWKQAQNEDHNNHVKQGIRISKSKCAPM